MYLSQVFSAKNKWVYSVICIITLCLSIPSIFEGSNENTAKQIQEMIDEMGELGTYAVSLFSFAIFLFPLFIIVYAFHNFSITQFTTSRKKIDWSRIFFAIMVFGGLQFASFLVSFAFNSEDYVWNFQPESFLWLFVISLVLLPIQIGFEEYFFRGYFMQWLALLSKNRWVPFFVSSLIFGLIHISNPEVHQLGYGLLFFYISSGLVLGLVSLMDDGLELALGIHFANNFVIAMLLTSDYSVFQTPSLFKDVSEPTLGVLSFISEILVNLLTIFIFAKKYRWTDWKQRLFGKITPQNQNYFQEK